MLKNSYKLLFLFSLFSGTMISINSMNWLSIWMGLEINLLSFIPLMMKTENSFSAEASLKYFLIQALASSSLLFSIIFFYCLENKMLLINTELIMNMILSISLMMKAGIAPFHFWFPNVMEGMSWINNFILMTWQKIAPLIILSFSMDFFLLFFMVLFSTFIGAMGGLNQTSMRKLMAFSSINHLGWMVLNLAMNENIWKIYFMFYSFLSFSIIWMLNYFKIYNLNQMFSFKINSMKKFIFNIPLLSLGGLPPFLGFFPKWMTIELAMNNNLSWLMLLMINFTLITLFFYIRISYSSILLNHNILNWNMSWNYKLSSNLIVLMINFYSLFGLFFISFFY